MYLSEQTVATPDNTLVAENKALAATGLHGAGIAVSNADVVVRRCTIASNDPSGIEVRDPALSPW